jgi:hypothetical protein
LANDRKPSLDDLQQALDMAGVADPTGAADALGAGVSLYRGDYTGAAISVLGIFGFDWLKKFRKWRKAGKMADEAIDAGKAAAKNADECVEGGARQVAKDLPTPKTPQQLIDTAAELGIGIEKLSIEGSVAKVKISYLPSVAEGGFEQVGALLKQQGVSKVVIDSGPVVDDVLAKRLSQLAARGDTYKGATVRFVKEEVSSLIPGKKVPYFEFEYTPK